MEMSHQSTLFCGDAAIQADYEIETLAVSVFAVTREAAMKGLLWSLKD